METRDPKGEPTLATNMRKRISDECVAKRIAEGLDYIATHGSTLA